jgi:hypothetical protein
MLFSFSYTKECGCDVLFLRNGMLEKGTMCHHPLTK